MSKSKDGSLQVELDQGSGLDLRLFPWLWALVGIGTVFRPPSQALVPLSLAVHEM